MSELHKIFPLSTVSDFDGRHNYIPIMAPFDCDGNEPFHPLLLQVLCGHGHMNKGQALEFAALIVHRVNTWDAMREALKFADKELTETVDNDAICEHSIGICNCEYRAKRKKMRETLTQADAGGA